MLETYRERKPRSQSAWQMIEGEIMVRITLTLEQKGRRIVPCRKISINFVPFCEGLQARNHIGGYS